MKKYSPFIIVGVILVAAVLMYQPHFFGPRNALACGWGSAAGGQGYGPQQRQSSGPLASAPSLTNEQVQSILDDHVSRLNPGLKVGPIQDNGGFYEAEILNENDEVVERLGVDKLTGRLMLIPQ